MGNAPTKESNSNNSTNISNKSKSNTSNKEKVDSDLLLIENISSISNELFQEYNENFLNNKFCNKLAVIYEKKLANLKLKTLKTHYQQINSEEIQPEFETFLSYSPPDTQKFIVNELRGELNELFFKKNVKKSKDLIKINEPYINRDTLSYLYYYKKQRGGETLSNLNRLIYSNSQRNNTQSNRPPSQNNNNNEINNSNLFENNVNVEQTRENIQNLERKLPQNYNASNQGNGNVRQLNKSINNLINNNFNNNSGNNNRNNSGNNSGNNNRNNSSSNKIDNNNRNNNNNNNNGNNNNGNMNNRRNNRNNNEENNETNVKKYCLSENMDCKLTKSQICKAITEHYMIRNNIIAAIMSIIPKKDKRGKLTSSFCYDRYNILNEGKFCLPPDYLYLNDLSAKERVLKLSLFINKLSEKDCKSINGYYKVLDDKEKKALTTKYNEFNNIYMKITLKLKEDFLINANILYDLLKKMKTMTVINNKSLNEIALKVKEIIDNMYMMCQKNYINAILALLKADLRISDKSQEDNETLLKYLEGEIAK